MGVAHHLITKNFEKDQNNFGAVLKIWQKIPLEGQHFIKTS